MNEETINWKAAYEQLCRENELERLKQWKRSMDTGVNSLVGKIKTYFSNTSNVQKATVYAYFVLMCVWILGSVIDLFRDKHE